MVLGFEHVHCASHAFFKLLGWETVTLDNILDLPLGTAEQKRTALAGLKSGEWMEWVNTSNTLNRHIYFDVDTHKLALFAIRVGVDAQRAVNIAYHTDNEMLIAVIAARGVKYALDFIRYACVSRRRWSEHSASVFGGMVVQLVDKLNLDIPQNVEYMKDWSAFAASAMGLRARIQYGEKTLPGDTGLPGLIVFERRFAEHIQTGVAVNTPATGPFGVVFPDGVKRGWLPRGKAIDLVFSALDASVRPGDRKVWLGVLDELHISDEELCARIQALIPLLATGDSAAIMTLAPVLIAGAEDELLTEVLLAALSATTKNTRQSVLKAALSRPCPENAEELAPWLSILADEKDKAVASLAAKLIQQWGVSADIMPEEKAEIQGLWQETPPVWQVPSFDLGEVSPEALTELAAKLVNQPAVIHDVTTERFLAMVNAVAYQNPEAARNSLRGLRYGQSVLDYLVCSLFDYIVSWVKKEKPRSGFDTGKKGFHTPFEPPLTARDYVVSLHLDRLPCLLSTPSAVDLSIRVPDLIARIIRYKETETDVLEADLFLALTRLDVKTKTPETATALQKLDVPVVLQSGEKMKVTAGRAVLAYLADPVVEPPLDVNKYGHWSGSDIQIPHSLHSFPNRLERYGQYELYSVFPHWGDVSLRGVGWRGEVRHNGLVLRQIARRAGPLPPGGSINLLAAQRSSTPDAAEDSLRAVTEAWERGLLRPGVADIAFLDWTTKPPSNLAALSSALDGIARDGALSVVWPVLDELIVVSLKAPRLLAGTAELAELISAFLPEVQLAVEKGVADKTALNLPGIRELAQRGGSSRAVSAAQKVATLLPPVQGEPQKEKKESAPVMDPPFDEIWPARRKTSAPIDDGVALTVGWADTTVTAKPFLFTLTLPGISDRVFQVVKNWYYDLENEGQCQAHVAAPGATALVGNKENQVWLHWDAKQKAMVVCDKRDWSGGGDGPSKGVQPPLLSSSLLTIVVGLLAQDGDAVYFAPRLLKEFIENGQIGEDMIRKATRTLLKSPVVSPAKLVRTLEKDVKLLPVLWPMLTECIKSAGALVAAGESPPVWVNRVLDIALRYAPYLSEAAKRGFIPVEDARWTGLIEIASSKAKSTAISKAKKLLVLLG